MRSRSIQGRPSVAADPPNKPKRITVDLDLDDYEALREWAHLARMSHSDVLRAVAAPAHR